MKNLHIYPSPITHENRIERETAAIASHLGIKNIIYGTYESGLDRNQTISENVLIKRLTLRPKNIGLIKKIFFILKFYYDCLKEARLDNINVVNVHSLSLLPLGVLLKKILKVKLVYDTHELETETHQLSGIRKTLSKKLELFCIKYCDAAIFVNSSIQDWYLNEYKDKCPVSCIVENSPTYRDIEKHDKFREKFNINNNTKIFLYQGALSNGRGIESILSAFENPEDDICLVIMGFGYLEDLCRKAADRNRSIFFHDAVLPKKLFKYTCSADYGINLIEPICLSYELCLPNKFFEYLMAGLPVLSSNLIEPKKIINKHKVGVIVEDLKIESINRSIKDLLVKDIDEFNENVKSLIQERSWSMQKKVLISFYEENII